MSITNEKHELSVNPELEVIPLNGSQKTEASILEGAHLVIKSPLKPYSLRPIEHETKGDFYRRRFKLAFDYILNEKRKENEALSVLPDEIKAPREHYFVGAGKDGLPAPFCVQELIVGSALRENKKARFSDSTEKSIEELLKANRRAFIKYGRCLDLVGYFSGEQPDFKTKFKHFFQPLSNSSNIFLLKDSSLALVDVKTVGKDERSTVFGILRFLSFELEYWRRVVSSGFAGIGFGKENASLSKNMIPKNIK